MSKQSDLMLSQGWISPGEAGRRIGVSSLTVMRLVEREGIRTQRAGRRWYLSVEDLVLAYSDAPTIQAALTAAPPPRAGTSETPKTPETKTA